MLHRYLSKLCLTVFSFLTFLLIQSFVSIRVGFFVDLMGIGPITISVLGKFASKEHVSPKCLVQLPRFEPELKEPQSFVLPLHHSGDDL